MLFIYFYDAVYKRAKNFWESSLCLYEASSAVFCQIANETLQNVTGSHFIVKTTLVTSSAKRFLHFWREWKTFYDEDGLFYQHTRVLVN